MKLTTFVICAGSSSFNRLGAVLDDDRLVDLNWAYATYLKDEAKQPAAYLLASRQLPSDMVGFLQGGQGSLSAAREALDFIRARLQAGDSPTGPAGEKLVYEFRDVTLKAPVPRPGKVLAAGRNFSSHLAESVEGWKEKWGREVSAPPFPLGFVKVSTAIVGPHDPVIYPRDTNQLDYEIELAIVIGRKAKHISKEEAYEYIAGYTVFNDISARDWQVEEMKNQMLTLGKNFDTLGPMGPWLVTKDEVKDPQDLNMELRVNGEVRQESNTKFMIYKIPDLVEHWSKMTLEPGDILTSGTPEGVALHRKPDPTPWYLKPGDVVEAEITGIGLIRNPIVAE